MSCPYSLRAPAVLTLWSAYLDELTLWSAYLDELTLWSADLDELTLLSADLAELALGPLGQPVCSKDPVPMPCVRTYMFVRVCRRRRQGLKPAAGELWRVETQRRSLRRKRWVGARAKRSFSFYILRLRRAQGAGHACEQCLLKILVAPGKR